MSTLAGKRLLIMHGTHIAAEIVRAAKRMGVTTVVADYNPVEKAPAKQIADEHYDVSLLEVDAVVELVKSKRIDGVAAGFSDLLLPYYAQVCERAGMPSYGTEEQFRLFTDKRKYRQLFAEYGIPTITGYGIEAFTNDADIDVDYPVIVKPAEGSGSRGIAICHTREKVLEAVARANDTFLGHETVIERFLAGEEVTAFWIFQDGEAQLSALANRHVHTYQKGSTPLPYTYTLPSRHLPQFQTETEGPMRRMFQDLGIQNGMMFIQGKIIGGTFHPYDVGYRLTGTQEYWLIEELSGYNPLEMLIHFALTGSMGEPKLHSKTNAATERYGFNVSVSIKPGTIARYEGLDEIAALPGVKSIIKGHREGRTLTTEDQGQLIQIALRVLGVCQTSTEAVATIENVRNLARIYSTEDEDLTLRTPPPVDTDAFL